MTVNATDASLAVILVNYNNETDTVACLETLANQSLDEFLTIVVDNGSEPESLQYVEDRFDFPIYLRNETNEGFTGGNNRGIETALDAGVEYVLLLNNDTEVEPTFLEDLLSAAEERPEDAGILGPMIHSHETDEIWAAGGTIDTLTATTRHRHDSEAAYDDPERVDYVIGAALLVHEEVFRHIGFLDDDFFIYYEETEFCERARDHGWSVWYVPVTGVYHKETNDFEHSAFRAYYFTRNRCLFQRKTKSWHVLAAFYPYYLVRWVLLQTVYLLIAESDTDSAIATVRGGIDALLNKTGRREF